MKACKCPRLACHVFVVGEHRNVTWTLVCFSTRVMRAHTHTHITSEQQTYIHAYIHTYAHTYIHAYMHTYTHIQTYTHTRIHARTRIQIYTHTNIHACAHTNIHAYTHTNIHTYKHTQIHAYKHTRIQTYTHTNIHAYKHTHTYTCSTFSLGDPRTTFLYGVLNILKRSTCVSRKVTSVHSPCSVHSFRAIFQPQYASTSSPKSHTCVHVHMHACMYI